MLYHTNPSIPVVLEIKRIKVNVCNVHCSRAVVMYWYTSHENKIIIFNVLYKWAAVRLWYFPFIFVHASIRIRSSSRIYSIWKRFSENTWYSIFLHIAHVFNPLIEKYHVVALHSNLSKYYFELCCAF